ncbi:MAG: hypothetical protein BHW60_02325 [Sutterella sp. 54_7]|nr:MAG: hypothetical protein BHW60_02325 [Sutterella sp. 54_7]
MAEHFALKFCARTHFRFKLQHQDRQVSYKRRGSCSGIDQEHNGDLITAGLWCHKTACRLSGEVD